MDVVVNEVDRHTVELLISVPWIDVGDEYSALVKRYSKFPVKGFRSGGAPHLVIEKVFRKELRADFTYKCGQRLCRKALQKEGLQAGSHIAISDADIYPNDKFSFKASFLRMPEFNLPDFRNLGLQSQNSQDCLTEISETLLNLTPFEVPNEFIDQELTFSDSQSSAEEVSNRKDAEKRVKLLLILKKIAEIDGIEVDEQDIETHIDDLASEYDMTPQELKNHLVETDGIYRLKDYILAEQVLKYIAEITN